MYHLSLVPHILAGSVALASGAAALSVRKGGRVHAKAGTIFSAAMLIMAGTGATIAAFRLDRETAVVGLLAFYLVATSWRTARRRDGKAGQFERIALPVPLGCAIALCIFGMQIRDAPAAPLFGFAAFAALAAALDLNFILRRRLSGAQRIARHLWRMCFALLIAAISFFIGQQKVMPRFIQGSPLLIAPEIAILGLMIYWLFRVRFAGMISRGTRAADPLAGPVDRPHGPAGEVVAAGGP